MATERITGKTDDGREGSVTGQHGGLESDPGTLVRSHRAGHRDRGLRRLARSARIVHDDQGRYFEINLG